VIEAHVIAVDAFEDNRCRLRKGLQIAAQGLDIDAAADQLAAPRNARSPVSFAAVSHGVIDLSAAQADIGEHAIVERHQLVDGAAHPAPGLEPRDQSIDPARQQRSDRSSGWARLVERRRSMRCLETSWDHHGISSTGVAAAVRPTACSQHEIGQITARSPDRNLLRICSMLAV
jgi:hypothetical protein